MALYAIAYAPALTGGTPSNTQQTGSFYVGNLTSGVRAWNNVVPQSTTNTIFFASPLANVGNGAPYVMAMPNPNQPAPFAGLDHSVERNKTSFPVSIYLPSLRTLQP